MWSSRACEQLIKEGKLTANGFIASVSTRPGHLPTGVSPPPGCPLYPEFEVGVEDDPVFLGLQPAMSPVRGFELATSVFHARLLRMNVIWGQVKRTAGRGTTRPSAWLANAAGRYS